jgi:DNA-binding beta-propeller fold protein YncE
MTIEPHKRAFVIAIFTFLLVFCSTPAAQAGSGNKSKQDSNGSATKAQNLVWPLPPEKPRIRYVEEFSNNFDIEPKKKTSWVDKLVGNPNPNHPEFFEKPAGIATDSRGRLLIASLQRSTVFILDKEKNEVLRVRGDRGIPLQTPLGLAVDSHDNFYVSDPMLHMVLKFGPDAHLQATLGASEGMKNPTFLAIDEGRRRLYVVDSHLHQVLVYNLDTLAPLTRFGKRGTGKGEFNFPVGIAVSPQGTIAVTDTGSCSVEIFSPDFKFIRRIGQQGTRPGDFVRPKGVAFDSEGNIWVVDAAFNNFQIFDPKGTVLIFVGAFGNVPGAFNLPLGIYIDRNNRVYISDQLNSRVQIFQFLGGK